MGPPGLARRDVRHVDLEHRERHRLDGVVQGDAVLRQPGRVDEGALHGVDALVQLVDEGTFVVRLEALELAAELAGEHLQLGVDLGQRRAAVDVRLAPAKEIEVGAVQDEDLHRVTMLVRLLVDAGQLVGVELGDGWIVGGNEAVGDRLGDGAHAAELGGGELVVGHALGFQLVDRFLRRGAADLALVGPGLVGGVVHNFLLGRRELVPELLADEHDIGRVDVVGGADVLLHLEELVREDDREGVLLAVDGLRFEGAVELAEGHRHRVGLEGLEGLEEDRVGDDADLQAVEVFGPGDGPLAVGDVAKAEVPVAERHQAFLGQAGDEGLAERAVEQGIGLRERADGERKVDQPELLDDAGQRGRRRGRHLLHAALQCRLLLQLVAQGRGRELLHLQLAAALGRHQLGEALHPETHRVVGVVEVAEADGALLDVLRPGGQGSGEAEGGRGGGEEQAARLGHGGISSGAEAAIFT